MNTTRRNAEGTSAERNLEGQKIQPANELFSEEEPGKSRSVFSARMLILLAVANTALFAAPTPQPFQSPVVFEPNRGQAPKQVKWIARTSGYMLFITNDGATMILPNGSSETQQRANQDFILLKPPQISHRFFKPATSTVQMKLTGSHPWNAGVGLEPTEGVSNYFLGSDPKAWLRDIPHYSRVRISGVYDGIDLIFYSKRNQLEYDFIVAAGSDPKKIQLAFEGAERLKLDETGDLVLTATGGSEIRHVSPHVFQQQSGGRLIDVAAGYELMGRSGASFTLASYDKRKNLIIDPTVTFTHFLAGGNEDVANGVAGDSVGNSYVTGVTLSTTNFPISDALQPIQQGSFDAFVTKLDRNGNVMFSTYWGGMDEDTATGIAVDSTGIYVTGRTLSRNFPGRYLSLPNGRADLFVTKFTLSGDAYDYSFVIGGSSDDWGTGIAVDAQHQAYITGLTSSANFPTIGPALTYFTGEQTAFLMKVSATGNITNSMYFGGSGINSPGGIAVDISSSPWITGITCSADFPLTAPSMSTAICNTFVTRLNSSLNGYEFSERFGGESSSGYAIAVKGSFGYVTGLTDEPNFPTTPGAFQKNNPSQHFNAFVMKLGFLGDLWYSTYLGATNSETTCWAIAADEEGNVYLGGETDSSAFPGAPPLTPNPTAGFVTKLNPQLTGLDFTTLLGASVRSIALYYPFSSVFPPQIYAAGVRYTGGLNNSNKDAFVVKLTQ